MPEISPRLTCFLKRTLPSRGRPPSCCVCSGGGRRERRALLRGDYFTIRDWLEIADYDDAEGLIALLLVLMLALEEGSLCVLASAESIASRLTGVVGADDARAWARRILDDLAADGFPRLIGATPADHRPRRSCTASAERATFPLFPEEVPQGRAAAARAAHRPLRLQTLVPAQSPEHLAAVLHEVLSERPLLAAGRPLKPDRDQLLAVGTALLRNLAIISGGPGTGKTSIVLTLLRCLVRLGYRPERIALAAPTGRAGQRLNDAVRAGLDQVTGAQEDGSPDQRLRAVSAGTLHQLLAYRPARNQFGRHAENPIPADVVIVDEVSMVGLVLMTQLLQALEPGAKLILLGDKDQLPSIDAGAVLAALVADGCSTGFGPELAGQLNECFPEITIPAAPSDRPLANCLVLLQTNHRSQAQIRAAAQAINAQRCRPRSSNGCRW